MSRNTVVGACHLLLRPGWIGRMGVAALALVGVLLTAAAQDLSAQAPERRPSIIPTVGTSIPILGFADYGSKGFNLGLRGTYPITESVDIGVDLELDRLGSATAGGQETPALTARRLFVGLKREAAPPETYPVSLAVGGGGGIVSFDSEPFMSRISNTEITFSHTYPAVFAGLELGFALNERLSLVGGSRFTWIFTKEEHTREIDRLGPAHLIRKIDSAQMVPMGLGLRIRL